MTGWGPLDRFSMKTMIRWGGISAVLILLVFVAGSVYQSHLSSHWSEIRQAEEGEAVRDFQTRFHAFEQSIHQSLDSIQQLPAFQLAFSTDDDSVQEVIFFTKILPQLRTNLSLEIYDEDKHLIGWNGPRGPTYRLTNLSDRPRTFVADDQIYTYLLVSHPLMSGPNLVGYLVGKRLLDVDYPINNRFINREAFQTAVGTNLPAPDDYDFSPKADVSSDPHRISVELTSSDGARLGYAYLHREDLDSRLQQVGSDALLIIKLLLLVIIVLLLVWVRKISHATQSPFIRFFLWTFILWALRYILLVINFPSEYLHIAIFDPVTYASTFGYGLAKSPGELFLTCAVLLVNVGVAMSVGVKDAVQHLITRLKTVPAGTFASSVLLVATMILSAALLRGFFAVVRSAVFDSTIRFNDPSLVFPSVEMIVMLLSLLMFSAAVTVVVIFLGMVLHRSAGVVFPANGYSIRRWSVPALVAVVTGALYGFIQAEPLVEPWQRIAFLLGILFISFWLEKYALHPSEPKVFASFLLVYVLALLLLVPVLNATVRAYNKVHIELAAHETAQPSGAWQTMIVQQALKQLRNEDAFQTLTSGDSDDVSGLAFRTWAKSILAKEGYLCSVTYIDRAGEVVSDFHIGVPPHPSGSHHVIVPLISPTFHREERVLGGRSMIWHTGFESLIDSSGDTLGGVLVEVSGTRQNILESEVPEFLRNYSGNTMPVRNRRLILLEYYDGKLVSSSDDDVPLTKTLPVEITSQNNGKPRWVDEQLVGRPYESYYSPSDQEGGNAWIALSIPRPTLESYFYSYLRYLVFFLLLLLVIVILWQVYLLVRRGPRPTSYRKKVMIAFCVVSIIPVLILGYYNRQATIRQSDDSITSRLEEQTSVVLAELQHQIGSLTPATLSRFGDDRCAQLASLIKTDFNIYLLRSFFASSKPEIFLAGVLDTRLSADAYANINIQRRKFFLEHQQIGTLPYVVGYRPVIAEDGSVIGVVSVPTLYRQIDINEDLTRRNSFLSGVYTLAIILSMLVATIFANQITSPIRRLTNATRQIGSGRLDFRVPHQSTDEMGQLEQAFEQMTENLRRTQEEMMRTQREVAWREMAKQVAHEIKNPLTPMKLALQHLRQAYADGVKNFEDLFHQVSNTLLEQIDTLNRIASEFSHYAKMPERQPQACDVTAILREAINLHRQNERITFKEQYDDANAAVIADREELRRVFINIVKNSIQAIPGEGKITVTCRSKDGTVEVRIMDTGLGIPPEVLSRIFEPNFSTKTEGTGLGLAIVKQIIDESHGTIRVTSEPGRGTSVTINLPKAGVVV